MYHPELQAMLARYDELVASAEQGLITVDDAMSTLASMVVVDAMGVEWRLDASGQFLRSMPGATPVLADPKMFTPASSVTGIPMPWSQTGTVPQQPDYPNTTPTSPYPSLHEAPVLPSRSMEPEPPYGAPPMGVVPQPVIPPAKRRLPPLPITPGKARTALVVLVCVIVAMFIVSSRGGDGEPGDSSVSTQGTQSETVPGDQSGENSSTEGAPATPRKITVEEASAVVRALSGKQSGSALAVSSTDDATMLSIAMPFAAAARLGYDVAVTDIAAIDSTYIATVEISFEGDTISTWSLPLNVIDGRVRATEPAVRA